MVGEVSNSVDVQDPLDPINRVLVWVLVVAVIVALLAGFVAFRYAKWIKDVRAPADRQSDQVALLQLLRDRFEYDSAEVVWFASWVRTSVGVALSPRRWRRYQWLRSDLRRLEKQALVRIEGDQDKLERVSLTPLGKESASQGKLLAAHETGVPGVPSATYNVAIGVGNVHAGDHRREQSPGDHIVQLGADASLLVAQLRQLVETLPRGDRQTASNYVDEIEHAAELPAERRSSATRAMHALQGFIGGVSQNAAWDGIKALFKSVFNDALK
jgi:hypothetical protein